MNEIERHGNDLEFGELRRHSTTRHDTTRHDTAWIWFMVTLMG